MTPQLDPIDDDSGTVFRDVIMLALLGFVAIVVLILPHVNPPGEAKAEITSPGNVFVEIVWPEEIDADVDLWVQAPGDTAVGYSNKGGTYFNLLRDDLGRRGDSTNMNYEVSFARGAPAGEYIVNVHLYASGSDRSPVPVSIRASLKPTPQSSLVPLATREVVLTYEGEEVTAIRFELDADAKLVPGTIHDLPRPLRVSTR